jgi:holo-[acyl-carrier protein] synthase
VGIDLLEVDRLELSLERRPRLAARLFTQAELDYAGSRRRPGSHLAARFAAKEAAVKALGEPVAIREIEVVGGDRQPPRLRLHGAAESAARRQGVELRVSLTHSRSSAAAVVVAVPARASSD